MTAESEVSKEVSEVVAKSPVVTEETSELCMSSNQDLPKPDCNGINHHADEGISHHDHKHDPDNSYVFVSGEDGLSDDPLDNKDVVGESLSESPNLESVEVRPQGSDAQNGELDVENGKISESLEEGEIGDAEGNGASPLLDKNVAQDLENSIGDGTEVHAATVDAPEEQNEKSESRADAELKEVEVQFGKTTTTEEVEIDQVQDQNGETGGTAEAVTGKVEDQTESEVSPTPVENQESHVVVLVSDAGLAAESGELNNLSLGINVSGDGSDKCEDRNNSKSTEESGLGKGSEDVINAVKCESRGVEVSSQEQIEVKLAGEVAETLNCRVPVTNSAHLDSDSPTNNEEEKQVGEVSSQEQIEVKSAGKIAETLECKVPVTTSAHLDSELSAINSEEVNTKTDLDSDEMENQKKEIKEDLPVAHVRHPEERDAHKDCNGESPAAKNSETETDVALPTDSFPTSNSEAHEPQKDTEIWDANSIEDVSFSPADAPELESNVENGPVVEDSMRSCNPRDANSELESALEIVDYEEKQPTFQGDDVHVQTEIWDAKSIENVSFSPADAPESESNVENGPVVEDSMRSCNPSDANSELESALEIVDYEEKQPTFQGDDVHVQTEIWDAKSIENVSFTPADAPESESNVENGPVVEDSMRSCNPSDANSELESALEMVDYEEKQPTFQGDDVHVQTEIWDAKSIEDVSFSPADAPESESIVENGPVVEDSMRSCNPSDANSELESALEIVDCEEKQPTFQGDDVHAQTEIWDSKSIEDVSFSPADAPESESNVENGPVVEDSVRCCNPSDANSELESALEIVDYEEKLPTFQGDDVHVQTEVSSGNANCAHSPCITADVKIESEVENSSTISSRDMTTEISVACGSEVSDGPTVNGEGMLNISVETEDVKNLRDVLAGAEGRSDENMLLQESKDTEKSHINQISTASPESSTGKDTRVEAVTKPFNFLIRIPRFNDEKLREQIMHAQLQVEEKTQLRDAIRLQIQKKRANCQTHGIEYEAAKLEDRAARKLVRSKRLEIDSLQSVINRAKNAMSIEDIDSRIHNMEHVMQHETLPLKEEKQFIREIKQLKQLREQLSSNMGSQDEIQQALDQREEVEERLKDLKKELDSLKGKVKELQAQFRAADDVRQAAYAQLVSLKKDFFDKNKHFRMYKDAAAAASDYAFGKNKEALARHCVNQVEKIMELWNTNNDFRKEYVKYNARSTVRRLGTLDGRSLGPDEEPPILPSYVDRRVDSLVSRPVPSDSVTQHPILDLKQETAVESVIVDDKSTKEVSESKNHVVKTKGPAKSIMANSLEINSGRELTDETQEEPVKSKEEVEMERKAEELKKQEAEAKLREQRRLEELTKAKEALERKKRNAEKAQMRAEMRAQKEAEQREKHQIKTGSKAPSSPSPLSTPPSSPPVGTLSLSLVPTWARPVSSFPTSGSILQLIISSPAATPIMKITNRTEKMSSRMRLVQQMESLLLDLKKKSIVADGSNLCKRPHFWSLSPSFKRASKANESSGDYDVGESSDDVSSSRNAAKDEIEDLLRVFKIFAQILNKKMWRYRSMSQFARAKKMRK
ncbi:titin-like protein [Forsythia ovata]|uniref:Titin-like protein n=1 Tax=Forsythia ovata TaxID=205694 RepID=A0ABD1UZH4_9LAMI